MIKLVELKRQQLAAQNRKKKSQTLELADHMCTSPQASHVAAVGLANPDRISTAGFHEI